MGLFDGQVLPDSVEDPYNEHVAGPLDDTASDVSFGEWRTSGGGNDGSVPAFKLSRITDRLNNPERYQEGTEAREEFVGDTPDFDSGRLTNRMDDGNPLTESDMWDALNVENPRETQRKATWAIYLIIAAVGLYLLKPLLELGANLSE